MGIIINDTIKMDTGIELKDAYERFVTIRSEKEGEIIIVSELYQSASARYNDMKPVAYNESKLQIDKDTFAKKFGELVYGNIKGKYTKTKDVLKDPVTEAPEITKSEVVGDDIVVEFTSIESLSKISILSYKNSEFPYDITNEGNNYKIVVTNYISTGRDLKEMIVIVKSDGKIKSEPIKITIDKWVHPLDNKEV